MRYVIQKAQELADAIAASETFRHMKDLEEEIQNDAAAAETINNMMRKRQRVEDLLTSRGMDPDELKKANAEMVQAEQEMNANEKVAALKKARKDFSDMMNNVNRILRLVITGEIREDDFSEGCSGMCDGCSGCGS